MTGGAAERRGVRLWNMEPRLTEPAAAVPVTGKPGTGRPGAGDEVAAPGGRPGPRAGRTPGPAAQAASAERAVTELYEAHALGMIRLAHIMLGDRQGAEDVVQDAFCGLYRRWSSLSDPGSAVHYVRSAVLNGCRSALRRRTSARASHGLLGPQPAVLSPESAVLTSEERHAVMAALRRLPARQREALVLRFYLDLSAEEAGTTMGISPSSVRSATHRALASLGRLLQESS
jgi:RNA polymerase sigma-70 factor (sigma-E family)